MKSNKRHNEDSQLLAQQIENSKINGTAVEAKLSTDEKVIARITDGIYRQPASAIRELVSNAYDADANNVIINTDFPRFEQITIRDDGNGMNEKTLANLIRHIGGSAKRDDYGAEIGVTNPNDSSKTIKGRGIIGKIGIGLFSVAQLTQQFQIITKVLGNDFRLIADVTLRTYTEDEILENPDNDRFESGTVSIRKVEAKDIDTQGTDIILKNLRKNALAILKSADIWTKVLDADDIKIKEKYKPTYHIGEFKLSENLGFIEENEMSLPWEETTKNNDRFKDIYSSVSEELGRTTSTPRLEKTFDNYFQMLWSIALSSPISYIDTHPFCMLSEIDEPRFFKISNNAKGKVEELELKEKDFRSNELTINPIADPAGGFNVYFDGIKLYRPIAFNKQKKSNSALKQPLMFYGKYEAPFKSIDLRFAGGELAFEVYFFWNSKILPLDHNGISIRINNASGTLFDSRWLGYPVAERTTLSQITAEVFVVKGLDSALNIDRESFNYAHPHYQILSKWVHNALRQITAKQKSLRSEVNKEKKVILEKNEISNFYKSEVAKKISKLIHDFPIFPDKDEEILEYRSNGIISCNREKLSISKKLVEEKLKLILSLLESKNMLSEMNYIDQEQLMIDLSDILDYGDK